MQARVLFLLLLVLVVQAHANLDDYDDFYYDYEESECLSDDNYPCKHGGRCVDEFGSYTCVCPLDFTGKNCEVAVNSTCLVLGCGFQGECLFQEVIGRPMCHCGSISQLANFCDPKLEPTTPSPIHSTTTNAPEIPEISSTPKTPKPKSENCNKASILNSELFYIGLILGCLIVTLGIVVAMWLIVRKMKKNLKGPQGNEAPSEPQSPRTVTTVA
ncbi:hypothetical protein L596_020500 [Steinernema carpocapsae]|uniref:EGF-like domain-containing protein n=1 Tax=Steinernema carpocapsae TaxID=34508 RepID=A0A4U5MTQ7_STECR|nr:hypothetical protein L596_020500 [Steinernema carpocapsae]